MEMAKSKNTTTTYKQVEDEDEKMDLLGYMLCLSRPQDKVQRSYMKHIEFMLLTMPTIWTVIDVPGIRPEFAELWASRYGEWDHQAGVTRKHNQLGMAWAWWALHEQARLSEITLADSPDIRALMPRPAKGGVVYKPCNVRGDIGRCSPMAMAEALGVFAGLDNIHDIWLSVLDWRTHVVIEFQYNVTELFRYTQSRDGTPDVALKKTFFCESCGEWTVDQDSRERMLEYWKERPALFQD
jgi:hypothetical protein